MGAGGADPKESYAIGFQGILDMKDVWNKYSQMNPGHLGNLGITGEWTTTLTVDTNDVDIDTAAYTVEAVQKQFEKANAETGSAFAHAMRVQSVSVVNGTFFATYRLMHQDASGNWVDGTTAGTLEDPSMRPAKVYFPSLEGSLTVSQARMNASASSSIQTTAPTVTGNLNIPSLSAFLPGVLPINFTNGVGDPVTIQLKQQPALTVTYSSADAAHALPAEITAMEYTEEGAIGSAPVTDLPRPAQTLVDTADIRWDWKGNEGMTRTQSACGGVAYNTKWAPTVKQTSSPTPAPFRSGGTDIFPS